MSGGLSECFFTKMQLLAHSILHTLSLYTYIKKQPFSDFYGRKIIFHDFEVLLLPNVRLN